MLLAAGQCTRLVATCPIFLDNRSLLTSALIPDQRGGLREIHWFNEAVLPLARFVDVLTRVFELATFCFGNPSAMYYLQRMKASSVPPMSASHV